MEHSKYPERLLPIGEVRDMTGKQAPTIYRDIANGRFPAPVKSGGSSRWLLSELLAYIEDLRRERDRTMYSKSEDCKHIHIKVDCSR